MQDWPRRWVWLVVGAAVLLLYAGCGKKTRPVPPGDVLPAPITDLAYELDEKGVTLTWTLPVRTVRGERLPYRIEKFEIERAVVAVKDYCEGCPVVFGEPVEITVPVAAKGQLTYREALLRPKHRYFYRVRSKAGWLVSSEVSNTVSLLWETPPQAPETFRIKPGDRALTLIWQAPVGLLDGSVVSDPYRYQLYRSIDGETFAAFGEPLDVTQFVDKQVRNDERYYYKIRAIRLHDGTAAFGMASQSVSAMPRDLVPPAPPQQVTAIKAPEGVRIVWAAVPEADLAGFRIYRRVGQAKPARIGEAGANSLAFVDTAPPRGVAIWYYTVGAYDQAGNESTPSMAAPFGTVE